MTARIIEIDHNITATFRMVDDSVVAVAGVTYTDAVADSIVRDASVGKYLVVVNHYDRVSVYAFGQLVATGLQDASDPLAFPARQGEIADEYGCTTIREYDAPTSPTSAYRVSWAPSIAQRLSQRDSEVWDKINVRMRIEEMRYQALDEMDRQDQSIVSEMRAQHLQTIADLFECRTQDVGTELTQCGNRVIFRLRRNKKLVASAVADPDANTIVQAIRHDGAVPINLLQPTP